MGRHVSPSRRRSLRGATSAALAGIIVLIGVAGFATYGIWSRAREPAGTPQVRSTAARTGAPTPATTPSVPTLALTVTGPSCDVFVGVPGGDVLVNRVLVRGQSIRFDDLRLNVALSDGGAVRVYVNGRLRPPGPAGTRTQFSAERE